MTLTIICYTSNPHIYIHCSLLHDSTDSFDHLVLIRVVKYNGTTLTLLRWRGSVVVSTSALHDRVLSSRPGSGMGMFGLKTWLSRVGTVYASHLIGDVKEPLGTTCARAVTTPNASIKRSAGR